MDVQWEWIGVLALIVVLTSVGFSVTLGVDPFTVFLPLAGMSLVGLAFGWMLRHIAHFNPYDY